jgi:hypothetical protein
VCFKFKGLLLSLEECLCAYLRKYSKNIICPRIP